MKLKHLVVTVIALVGISVTTTAHADVPWEQNNGHDIYQPTSNGNIIYYQNDSDYHYSKVWNAAINAWNNLGVISLQPIPNGYSGTYVKLTGQYDVKTGVYQYKHSNNVLGITYYSYFLDNSQMTNTNSNLTVVCSALKYKYEVLVAEHELGHALGFAHDTTKINGKHVIMYANPTFAGKPLGNYEKQALLQHYK